jgi:hypothetical protein
MLRLTVTILGARQLLVLSAVPSSASARGPTEPSRTQIGRAKPRLRSDACSPDVHHLYYGDPRLPHWFRKAHEAWVSIAVH